MVIGTRELEKLIWLLNIVAFLVMLGVFHLYFDLLFAFSEKSTKKVCNRFCKCRSNRRAGGRADINGSGAVIRANIACV